MSESYQKALLLDQYRKSPCLGQRWEKLSDINPTFLEDRSECSATHTKYSRQTQLSEVKPREETADFLERETTTQSRHSSECWGCWGRVCLWG